MTLARQSTGRLGEDLACRELARRGYAVLARRYRTRHGEIDIVARHAGTIVFVEVKARHGGKFGDPADAVTTQNSNV
jgi:putative endonuclease